MKRANGLPGKPVIASAVEHYPYILFPAEMNANDAAFGGGMFALMDRCMAGPVFKLHARVRGTTGSYQGNFTRPLAQGDLLTLRCSINRVWGSSCEIGVKVFLVDQTGEKDVLVPAGYCYYYYVAQEFDENGARKRIPPVVPETDEQKRRFREAHWRRAAMLKQKQRKEQKSPV